MTRRRQATLYLPDVCSSVVESIRCRFNHMQFDLIRAHVTLCREDEVQDWDELETKLAALGAIEIPLDFGTPVRDGNLVYLPSIGSNKSFDTLRNSLLSTSGSIPRKHNPHVTLVHPRNGICSASIFDEINSQSKPFSATFRFITLIQQIDGGRWQDLKTFG